MSTHTYAVTVLIILAAMAAVTLLEVAIPLYARSATWPGRRRANLAMTAQTLLTAFVVSSAAAIVPLHLAGAFPGLTVMLNLPAPVRFVVGLVALDFAFGYAAHRTMHAWPALWRFHRVHHSDPFVDVTTTLRTHPVETLWRHLWLFAAIWVVGVPAAAVVAFRLLSALNGLLEHANLRVRPALDAALSLLWVTPNMHKVHHSRRQTETDANYGNIFAVHDRLLGTFLPTTRALTVQYGLDDVDPRSLQSFPALLAMPWREQPH